MNPYREPVNIPERRRIVPKWLTLPVWIGFVTGVSVGGAIDHKVKPVVRVEVPTGDCRDEIIDTWQGGCAPSLMRCSHPLHAMSLSSQGHTMSCTCPRSSDTKGPAR